MVTISGTSEAHLSRQGSIHSESGVYQKKCAGAFQKVPERPGASWSVPQRVWSVPEASRSVPKRPGAFLECTQSRSEPSGGRPAAWGRPKSSRSRPELSGAVRIRPGKPSRAVRSCPGSPGSYPGHLDPPGIVREPSGTLQDHPNTFQTRTWSYVAIFA